MNAHHIHRTEKYILTLWFVASLCIGLAIVQDFGISWDEPEYYVYAQNTVDAYKSVFGLAYTPVYGPSNLPHYGPAFIIIPELAIRLLRSVFPGIFAVNIWHFSYFFIFLLGGICLYLLSRRWFRPWTAWGMLLLYTFQPVLWGHAFINPKDIPFMVFCLFTIWSGFRFADSLGARSVDISMTGILRTFRSFSVVQKISNANAVSQSNHFKLSEFFSILFSPRLVFAGVLLGFTTSIRILGPLPGLIVILYLVFTLRYRSVPIVLAYLVYGVITTFLTWPYLWPDPIRHFWESVVLMSSFDWPGHILFNGAYFTAGSLPISYLPVLLNIQLTEFLILLIYVGFVIFLWNMIYKHIRLDLLLVIVLGALMPLAGLIIFRVKMYDNFRQFLFIIPPLILLAGLALDKIFSVIKSHGLRVIILLVLIAPGPYAIVRLHPYEYIYYNALVGGTRGARGNYELDYWATSYREAALSLNENAPSGARVAVFGPVEIVNPYTRPDIQLNIGAVARKLKETQNVVFNYAIVLSRKSTAEDACRNAKTIKTVERDGALLMVLKEIPPGQTECP
jgi:hypothetical protein